MGAKAQVLKGKIEEAAGVIANSDRLRDRGKADQAIGKAKIATQKVVKKVAKTVRKALNRA